MYVRNQANYSSPYPFKLKFKKAVNQKHLRCKHAFTFKNKLGFSYIVSGDQYDHDFFAIKFHLKKHNGNRNRFKVMTGQFDAIRILNTVVGIMVQLKKDNAYASFGFIGMACIDENICNTKRFKVYGKISKKYFNPENFFHIENEENSTYLIVDKKQKTDMILDKIKEIFDDEIKD